MIAGIGPVAEPIGVAVIGAGAMGSRHLTNLAAHPLARVVAVVDVAEDRARSLAEPLGAEAFAQPDDALAVDGLDAVIVASPDDTHTPLALACLERGLPALIEKPLGVDTTSARRVVDAEVELGRRLIQVGFMRHYDPAHLQVRAAIDSGRIGQPVYLHTWHRNPYLADIDNGAESMVFNSAIHDLQSVRWLLDGDIAEVAACLAQPSQDDAPLLVSIRCLTPSGRVATIEMNRASGFGYEVGLEVVGTAGTARMAPSPQPEVRADGQASVEVEQDWADRFVEAYVRELDAWLVGLASGQVGGPSAWDGYATVAVAEAAIRSITTGRPEPGIVETCPDLYSG